MMNQLQKMKNYGLLLLAIFAITFTSCNQDAELVDVESFTNSSIESLQYRAIAERTNHS